MLSLVKLVLIFQVVSVWSAPLEVQWLPVILPSAEEFLPSAAELLPSAAELPQFNYWQEMRALAQLYQKNKKTINVVLNAPKEVMDFSDGFKNVLPSSLGNTGIFLHRLNNNFNSRTTTEPTEPPTEPTARNPTPQVNDTRKTLSNTGDIDSIVIDAETTTEKIRNNSVRNSVATPVKEGKLGIGAVINGIPFLPFEINVPDTFAWLAELIVNIFSKIGSKQKGQVDNPPYSNALEAEEIKRILLEHSKYRNSGALPFDIVIRNRNTILTTVPYQTVIPVAVV